MTLQQLRYAITIADCGSMNEAAKHLFISQPSLSETMKELENEIGFDIFLRSNRGIIITPEGEEFLGYAREVTEQFGLSFNIQFILSAIVAALTVGGKALGKGIANKKATPIVHAVGTIFSKFKRKK